MMRQIMVSQRLYTFTVLIACLAGLSRAQKPTLTYCSPNLNAGIYTPMSSDFQSTGLCSDHCAGAYAFAIVQDDQCWCSNYVPEDQVDTSDCNSGCPGISSEWCGNKDDGLYGYFQIPLGTALGTSGDSGGSAPKTSSSSSQRTRSSSTTTSSPSSSSSITEKSDSTTSSSASITASPSFFVTTVTGQATTIVITSAPAATDDAVLGQSSTGDSSGVSSGTIAGIVVGVVGGIALLAGGLVWFFCRRRRQANERSRTSSFTAERIGGSSSGNQSNSVPSRQVSQMSQAGLLGSKAPRIQTSGLGGGLAFDPRSPDTSSNVDRRSVGTDQRLNPWAIYKQDDQVSSVSLHDDRDYSRQLRVANPDD